MITGAGLVGSQIARLEVEKGERPVLFDVAPQVDSIQDIVDLGRVILVRGDVLNPMSLVAAIRRHGVERIVHTAANPMLTVGAQDRPYEAIQLNIMGLANVLEACRLLDLKRLVFTSSAVLYTYRVGEDNPSLAKAGREDAFSRPSTIYSSTKQAGECLGMNYADSYGVDFIAVRLVGVFGPWKGKGGGNITEAIRSLVEKTLRGEKAVFGRRNYELSYSKDAAYGVFRACHAERTQSRVFNIGTGESYTADQVVAAVKEIIPGANASVEELKPSQARPERSGAMDISKARTELGFEPRYPLKEALKDYVGWVRKQIS